MPSRDEVFEALRRVEDPELGMDIVELGLLYDVEVEDAKVTIVRAPSARAIARAAVETPLPIPQISTHSPSRSAAFVTSIR